MTLHLLHSLLVYLYVLRWRHIGPVDTVRVQILSCITNHPEKCIVCFRDSAMYISEDDTNDVGVYQSSQACFTFLHFMTHQNLLSNINGVDQDTFNHAIAIA